MPKSQDITPRIRELVEAFARANDPSERAERVDALREALTSQETSPEHRDARILAAAQLLETGNDAGAMAALRDALEVRNRKPITFQPLSDWRGLPEPDPVLWRDNPLADPHSRPDAVLSVGEIAILAAPGGTGKSYTCLHLALAAARAEREGGSYGAACGLRVRPGPVAVITYEDSGLRIGARVQRMGAADQADPAWSQIHVLDDPDPLFTAHPVDRATAIPSTSWRSIFSAARDFRPALIIIDPISAAFADVSASEGGPVREFMRALTAEAEVSQTGILLIAHDTKSARNEARGGGDPGAGAVAGSSQWYDAARGVLYLRRDPTDPDSRLLECIKANHGRARWGAALSEDFTADGEFLGFRLDQRLDPQAMRDTLNPRKAAASKPNGAATRKPSPGAPAPGPLA